MANERIDCEECGGDCKGHREDTTVSESPSVTGLCRLPREAIEVEDDWQSVQDHVEDEDWTEASHALSRMRETMLNLEAYLLAKRVTSA